MKENEKIFKIKLSLPYNNFPIVRQTPNAVGRWRDCQFFINDQNGEPFDGWVVYDQLNQNETSICIKENTILFTAEPPSIKFYSSSYFRQFSKVVTCHPKKHLQNIIENQQALPWMAGIRYLNKSKSWDLDKFKDINSLASPIEIEKLDKVCIITSNKVETIGHRKRLNFVLKLKEVLPDFIDIYGVGFQPVEDKLEVLSKYKYSLVIENSEYNNYWTEKLSDAFIAETYPFYYGCPNILNYFDEESLSIISFDEEAIKTIKKLLENNAYEERRNNILKAKNLVLFKYNLFEVISSLIERKQNGYIPVALRAYNNKKNAIWFRLNKILLWFLKKK